MLRDVFFEVLVVLGCPPGVGSRPGVESLGGPALRRVERAARAYHEEGAEQVIACGGKAWAGLQECEAFARGLVERGVPAEKVFQERQSHSTWGNARGVFEILGRRTDRKLGVVTCDWHLPRALRLFRQLGLDAVGVPAISPPRPLHQVAARYLRERGSLALDLLSPAWLRS